MKFDELRRFNAATTTPRSEMTNAGEESVFGLEVDAKTIAAVKSFWKEAQTQSKPIHKFDALAKGWDRLASELFPDDSISHRFKRLTGHCSAVAWAQSVDDLFVEVEVPIRNDLERLEHESQRDFDRAKKRLREHRDDRRSDQDLMESIGSLLWTIRSNSMHGRKTPSGPSAPTNRDEQICDLGARVLEDLYKCAFPSW